MPGSVQRIPWRIQNDGRVTELSGRSQFMPDNYLSYICHFFSIIPVRKGVTPGHILLLRYF